MAAFAAKQAVAPPLRPAPARQVALAERGSSSLAAIARGFDLSRTPARTIQRKPSLGAPDDAFEREADSVADTVMRMPDAALAPAPSVVQRKCAQCTDEDEGTIRTKRSAGVAEAADTTQAAHLASQGGMPLPREARAFFEPRFGHDFSQVRVHADTAAADAARSVQARAYTLGSHIVFGAGEYAPKTQAGRSLLAHELTHVVQQGGGRETRAAAARVSRAAPGVQRYLAGDAGHGGLEEPALQEAGLSAKEAKLAYFGNWLRDYSQAIDVGTVKSVSAEAIRLLLW